MRDPRTLGPYRPPPPDLIEMIRGVDYAPAPALAQEAAPPPSIGQRLSGLAGGALRAVGDAAQIPLLIPQAIAGTLRGQVESARMAPQMARARLESAQAQAARAAQQARLGEAQFPAEQAQAAAQVRYYRELEEQYAGETDPDRRAAIARAGVGGPFRPFDEFEPSALEVAAMQQTLGMDRDAARHELRMKEMQARSRAAIEAIQRRAELRPALGSERPLSDAMREQLQSQMPDVDFSSAATTGEADRLIRAASAGGVSQRHRERFERLPAPDARIMDDRATAIGMLRSIGESIPDFDLGFFQEKADLAKWYGGLNDPQRAALRQRMHQSALSYMSAVEGGRPSDKDRDFYLGLLPGPADSNATAAAKMQSMLRVMEAGYKQRLRRYRSEGYSVEGYEGEDGIPQIPPVRATGEEIPDELRREVLEAIGSPDSGGLERLSLEELVEEIRAEREALSAPQGGP